MNQELVGVQLQSASDKPRPAPFGVRNIFTVEVGSPSSGSTSRTAQERAMVDSFRLRTRQTGPTTYRFLS